MGLSLILAALPLDVPVDPDAPTAHDLLFQELAKQEYVAAKPTWFDNLIQSFTDWIQNLRIGQASGPPAFGLLVTLIAVGVLLLVAFLVFGLPRINRRSRVTGALFGEDDARTAARIRVAAEAAAASGDFAVAIAEMFRSIARGLAERSVLSTSPGTTAREFAVQAGRSFPAQSPELVQAATAFDEVRYLGRDGSREQYDEVAQLERRLRSAKPLLETAVS